MGLSLAQGSQKQVHHFVLKIELFFLSNVSVPGQHQKFSNFEQTFAIFDSFFKKPYFFCRCTIVKSAAIAKFARFYIKVPGFTQH
jgi:hypothetical protein